MSMYGAYPKNADGTEKVAWPSTSYVGDRGFTVQADRDEADINKIIARFNKTGQLPPVVRGEPFYGDVSYFGDLAESLIKVQEADELFMSFPAELRERFENDKVKFLEFVGDDKNRDEAIKLGLIQKAPVPDQEPSAPAPAAP